jgi:hypothetical protein
MRVIQWVRRVTRSLDRVWLAAAISGCLPERRKYMKEQEFLELRDGDVIRSRMSGAAYLVQKTDGDLTAVRVVVPKKPEDWTLVAKATLRPV